MINKVTSYYLNKIIEREIKEHLEIFWKTQRVYWFNWNYYFGGQEVKAFIFSSPYFSQDLKEFLYDTDRLISLKVTEEWYYKFLGNVCLWAEGDEWLYPDNVFNGKTSNKENDLMELDLAPHHKEILYNNKLF